MKEKKDEQKLKDLVYMLYDQSVFSRADHLENPIQFVNRLNILLVKL